MPPLAYFTILAVILSLGAIVVLFLVSPGHALVLIGLALVALKLEDRNERS